MSDVQLTIWSRMRGLALFGWIVMCDAVTKMTARLGGCPDDPVVDRAFLQGMTAPPSGCKGTELAGPTLLLIPGTHDGALLGLSAGQFAGFMGQVYALSLIFASVALTILIRRWKYQTGADARILALVWAGAATSAAPRLMGTGSGWYEINAFGLLTGIGELALVFGLFWALWRLVAELIG